jgi:hypothetical protein
MNPDFFSLNRAPKVAKTEPIKHESLQGGNQKDRRANSIRRSSERAEGSRCTCKDYESSNLSQSGKQNSVSFSNTLSFGSTSGKDHTSTSNDSQIIIKPNRITSSKMSIWSFSYPWGSKTILLHSYKRREVVAIAETKKLRSNPLALKWWVYHEYPSRS